MTFISYAQNLEDAVLFRALRDVSPGFYVDVGAHHPSFDSVTRAFYDRGWRGINIEPLEKWLRALEQERPEDVNLGVLASDRDCSTNFYEIGDASGLSTTLQSFAEEFCAANGLSCRKHKMLSRSLNTILQHAQPTDIHFLKIDAEGAEHKVLAGLDLERFRPWIIMVEATKPLSQLENHQSWELLVTSKRYSHVYSDGLNRFYLAGEHQELADRFDYPPNVFDQVIPFQLVNIHTRLKWELRQIKWGHDGSCDVAKGVFSQPNSSPEYYHNILLMLDAFVQRHGAGPHDGESSEADVVGQLLHRKSVA